MKSFSHSLLFLLLSVLISSFHLADIRLRNEKILAQDRTNYCILSNQFLDQYQKEVVPVNINESIKLDYLTLFPTDGIQNRVAFVHKKSSDYQTLTYEGLYLLIIEYQTLQKAQNAFLELANNANHITSPAAKGNSNSEANRVYIRGVDPKHGGFIFQQDQYIFSLGKRCLGYAPNMSDEEYEQAFLGYLKLEIDTKVYSSCGDSHFSVIPKL